MIYEYTLKLPYNVIADTIDKLNEYNIYNLYYNVPIEITKVENGFSFIERENEKVELKIFVNDQEDNFTTLKELNLLINKATGILTENLTFKIYDQSYGFTLEDIDLGNNWIISYSLKKYPNKNIIKFEPQTAFGTGLHQTTQACLKIILDNEFTGKRVLDLGTGSGILSLAAGIKKAEYIEAIDIEPVMREIQHNADLNAVDNINVIQADLLLGDYVIDNDYDWIFINIGASETLSILEKHKLLKGQSKNFIISGVVEWNYQRVIAKFAEFGYKIVQESHDHDWVTLHFKQ